jgi:two-component system, OmpR family, osmolarity sensor histidine kinase EnvZ
MARSRLLLRVLGRRKHSLSLFWRTFFFLGLLLLGSNFAWFKTFQKLEEEPNAVQSAQQLASLVNLTRAALVHSDSIALVSLIKTLADEENVRIAVREPSDVHQNFDQDALSRRIREAVISRLGPKTIVAREVNGFEGLWIGFEIEGATYWLLTDPERIDAVDGTTWLVWLSIAGAMSMLGAVVMARLINKPLRQLAMATGRMREGDFKASHLDEDVPTSEIRAVNIGFNRMAKQLAKAEADRTLMLAGISHDLRTPLARLRLEAEMSVEDETALGYIVSDIEQVNTIIDKFLDYARADYAKVEQLPLSPVVEMATAPLNKAETLDIQVELPQDLWVQADAVELQRVLVNLLENAHRYARGSDGVAHVHVSASEQGPWVVVQVRDHGPGVSATHLQRLTDPFFRGDEARTAVTGSGLGLAIVKKTITRMGGDLQLSNHPDGGLVAVLQLKKADKSAKA